MLSETLIKTLLKSIDIEKIQKQALDDPRVREALDLVTTIKNDFAEIKETQNKILSYLDKISADTENARASKRKAALPAPNPEKEE